MLPYSYCVAHDCGSTGRRLQNPIYHADAVATWFILAAHAGWTFVAKPN
jgi:hypothetical protein